jgi:hypothetical protein
MDSGVIRSVEAVMTPWDEGEMNESSDPILV